MAAGRAPEPALAPLRQVSVRDETNEVVSEKQVVKGYEYEKNRYVALDPEELKSLDPRKAAPLMRAPKIVVDGRNVLDPTSWREAGLRYAGFGRE